MIIYKILRVLYALFKTRDKLLAGAVVKKILESVDEICVLSKVKIFPSFTLLAHPATRTGVHCANKRQHLLIMLIANHLFGHDVIILYCVLE